MCMHRNVLNHKAWAFILLVLIIIHCLKSDWKKKNWCKGSVKQAGVINFPTYLKTFLAVIEKVTRPSRSWFPCVRNSAQLHAHDAYRSQIKKTVAKNSRLLVGLYQGCGEIFPLRLVVHNPEYARSSLMLTPISGL